MKKRQNSFLINSRNLLIALLILAAAATTYAVVDAATVSHQGSEIIGKVAEATKADNSDRLQGVPLAEILAAGGGGWTVSGANSVKTGSGKVGIGTATPSATLHVNSVGVPENPLKAAVGSLSSSCFTGDPQNVGIRFTPLKAGQVTQVGWRGNRVTATVRLYNMKGDVLASASVTVATRDTWVYADVTPVRLDKDTSYVVSVFTNGACYNLFNTPTTSGNVRIEYGVLSKTTALPGDTWPTLVYDADVTFVPDSVSIITNGVVGIGTTSPQNKLDVEGGEVIGATYSGTNTAPADGLLVEGKVGIGTTNPGAKLDVAGQVKITGGAPGAGKVLTSDAAGLASWQTPAVPTSSPIPTGLYGWIKHKLVYSSGPCPSSVNQCSALFPGQCSCTQNDCGESNCNPSCAAGYTMVITAPTTMTSKSTVNDALLYITTTTYTDERFYACYKN